VDSAGRAQRRATAAWTVAAATSPVGYHRLLNTDTVTGPYDGVTRRPPRFGRPPNDGALIDLKSATFSENPAVSVSLHMSSPSLIH
jgi:hypothetical protein